MGILRAISEPEKRQRRQQILNVAGKLLLRTAYRDITVARLAEAAGVAKGTIFLYFQTKEDIFLSLAQDAMTSWQGALRASVGAKTVKGKPVGAADLARMLIRSVDDPVTIKLFTMLDDTLEQNIDKQRAFEFKSFLKVVLASCGELVESVLPRCASGDGVRLLNGLFVCLVGAHKVSAQSETIREVARLPGMEMFRRDFDAILEHMAICYVSGFLATLPPR